MKGEWILGLAVCGVLNLAVAQTERGPSDLRELLSVRSVGELNARTRGASARKLAQDTCTAELNAHLLPRSCFREIALSESTVRVGHDGSRARRLTRICIENAKTSRSRLDLSGSLDDLPSDCRRAVEERIEDFQYIDEGKSPGTSVLRTPGPELEESSHD